MQPKHDTMQKANVNMHVRDTDELTNMLEHSRNLTGTLRHLQKEMNAPTFTQQLAELMARQGMNAAQLSEAALLSKSFTYQLCSGERQPSRDIVLRLALVMNLSLDEAQSLLRTAQRGALYPRVIRDAILIFALKNHLGIQATHEQLLARDQAGLL